MALTLSEADVVRVYDFNRVCHLLPVQYTRKACFHEIGKSCLQRNRL
jgi:hypothetical protein